MNKMKIVYQRFNLKRFFNGSKFASLFTAQIFAEVSVLNRSQAAIMFLTFYIVVGWDKNLFGNGYPFL